MARLFIDGCASMASMSGLGVAICVEGEEKNELWLLIIESVSSGDSAVGVLKTGINDSAYHSYHTCLGLVRRQMETWSSELLGRYNGAFCWSVSHNILVNVLAAKRTLNGKKSGNQLSISLEI